MLDFFFSLWFLGISSRPLSCHPQVEWHGWMASWCVLIDIWRRDSYSFLSLALGQLKGGVRSSLIWAFYPSCWDLVYLFYYFIIGYYLATVDQRRTCRRSMDDGIVKILFTQATRGDP